MAKIMDLDLGKQEMPAAETISAPVRRRFSWKIYLFLVVLIIPATFAALPYTLAILSATIEADELPRFIGVALVDGLIYAVLAGIGLFLAGRIGLGLPFVESWLEKRPAPLRFRYVLTRSVAVGMVTGVVVIALSLWIFLPALQAQLDQLGISLPESIRPAPWQGFLASFDGGIVEEALFRLFGLTLLAWLGSLVSHDQQGRPTVTVFWIANLTFAVMFGLAHLPGTAAIGLPLNALVVTRAIVLNGAAGIAFGWLYWKWGLESAMLAHFSADIVAHVIFPLVISLVS